MPLLDEMDPTELERKVSRTLCGSPYSLAFLLQSKTLGLGNFHKS